MYKKYKNNYIVHFNYAKYSMNGAGRNKHNTALLKYTKDRQIERMEKEQQWNNPNISLFENTYFYTSLN